MGSIPYRLEGLPKPIFGINTACELSQNLPIPLSKINLYAKIMLLRSGCPPHSDGAFCFRPHQKLRSRLKYIVIARRYPSAEGDHRFCK